MNILIIGCGRVGKQLATQLCLKGNDVSIIDSEAENIEDLGDDFNGIAISGNPMDLEVLRNAGIEGCDAMAVVSHDDNLNITVSQIAKEFFGITQIITRVSEPQREDVFKHFGLRTICPTDIAAEAIHQSLNTEEKPHFQTYNGTTVTVIKQKVCHEDVGKKVKSIVTHSDEFIFAVLHSNDTMTLYDGRKDIILKENDIICFNKIVE